MKLVNTAEIVKSILIEDTKARDDDYWLWLRVIEKTAQINDVPDFSKVMPFGDFLAMAKFSKFPHYETVSRARRKLQEKHPELRSTIQTIMARSKEEERFRDFAKNY